MLILNIDILWALRRPDQQPRMIQWLAQQRDENLFLSVITVGELEQAVVRQEGLNQSLARDLREWIGRTITLFSDRLLPIGSTEAQVWGQLSARLGHSSAGLLIAATALAQQGAVVTGDITGFKPTGCKIIDPFS